MLRFNKSKSIVFLFFYVGICLICFSCSKETESQSTDNSKPSNTDQNIVVEPTEKQLVSLIVTNEDFTFWNSNSPNSSEAAPKMKELTKRIYTKFKDDFDFIVFVMNNENLPSGRPTGEFAFVKNDVKGIGLPLSDYTKDFGSAGKLQGVYFLYKKNYLSTTTYGPILHEMAHRWANWVVPTSYSGHWGPELNINGQLNKVDVPYADIELYLMGLMPANQMRDPASIAAYNLIPAESKVRTPSADNSQHSFKSLLVIMTPQPLTNSEVSNFNAGATLLCRTDNPSQGTNFKKMTKGLGTLTVGDLDKSIR